MPKSALAAIEARQHREVQQRLFNRECAEDLRLRLTVDWEKRTDRVVERKDLVRHLDRVQAQHNDVLVARRQRLAAMLLREREEHEAMLSNLVETEEQRRERLVQKARELRAQQEEELRVDAEKRHERLFREKIDTLRLAESRLKVMQVSDARFEQLSLAERRRAEKKHDDEFFAQQGIEAQRLSNERARRDLEDLYVLRERTKEALGAQVEGNRMRKALEKEAKQKEDMEFNQMVEAERQKETQKRMDARATRAAFAKEMSEFNEQLRLARRQEYDQLQQKEKEVLDELLQQLRDEEQKEKQRKQERRESTLAHMQEVYEQLNKRKGDEGELDKLWEEANNKEWEKKEARWRADQQKRDALMRSVLIARRQQVLDKRKQERDDAEKVAKEREEYLRMLNSSVDIDAVERARRYALLRENQKYLEAQMQERANEKAAARLAIKSDLTEQQALESEFAERIKREMENLERAKPERYKNVPLLPKQRYQPF